MKNIIIALSFLFLSGCAVIQPVVDRFFMAPFDSNEYALVNKLRTVSMQTKPLCGMRNVAPFDVTDNVYVMYDTALLLKNYSQYLLKNEQTYKPVSMTYTMVSELKERYGKETKVSKTYCELKIQSIIDASETIQRSIGKRPRP